MLHFIAVGNDSPAKVIGTAGHTCYQMCDISAGTTFSRPHRQVTGTETLAYFFFYSHSYLLYFSSRHTNSFLGRKPLFHAHENLVS